MDSSFDADRALVASQSSQQVVSTKGFDHGEGWTLDQAVAVCRAVEDVCHRADDEQRCPDPEEEDLVPVLEVDDDARDRADRDAGESKGVRRDRRAREVPHPARCSTAHRSPTT